MSPRAAYIHVPFCAHRCGYCNFTVVSGRDDLISPYLEAISRELSWLETPRDVETLYIGGGTPTQLALHQLRRLLDMVQTWFPITHGGEITVEANPTDINPQKLDALQAFGVTRLSLGTQSFQDAKLEFLERDHRRQEMQHAIRLARDCFESISLDLIFGTPGETLDQWCADLQAALALETQHVSTYGLTYEKGTLFWNRLYHGEFTPVGEEVEREMYESAIDSLTSAGFEHYEVSSFAKPGYRCKHNEVYWTGREYYAAGPGAARYVDGRRETNHRSVSTYLKRVLQGESPVDTAEQLTSEQAAREQLVFGLRRLEGVDCGEFEQHTGYSVQRLGGQILEKYLHLRLLETHGETLRLTHTGLMVSDSMWPDLL